jgi:hypothetical protein
MDSKLFPFYGKFDSFHMETIGKKYAHDYVTYSLEYKSKEADVNISEDTINPIAISRLVFPFWNFLALIDNIFTSY